MNTAQILVSFHMVSMLLLPTSIILVPCVGSGVVRIDPLRFVAGCHKR